MTSLIPIQCLACTRLRRDGATCAAFPSGIPVGILSGDDHRVPVRGDHGKRFIPRKDTNGKEAFETWNRVFGATQGTLAPTRKV